MVDEIVTIGQENFPRVFLFLGTIVRAKAAGADFPAAIKVKKRTSPKGGLLLTNCAIALGVQYFVHQVVGRLTGHNLLEDYGRATGHEGDTIFDFHGEVVATSVNIQKISLGIL